MGRLRWTEGALADVRRIRAYVTLQRPLAAARLATRLIAAGESLGEHPLRGRPAGGHQRELVTVPPYLIRYRVAASGEVLILEVRHGARDPD